MMQKPASASRAFSNDADARVQPVPWSSPSVLSSSLPISLSNGTDARVLARSEQYSAPACPTSVTETANPPLPLLPAAVNHSGFSESGQQYAEQHQPANEHESSNILRASHDSDRFESPTDVIEGGKTTHMPSESLDTQGNDGNLQGLPDINVPDAQKQGLQARNTEETKSSLLDELQQKAMQESGVIDRSLSGNSKNSNSKQSADNELDCSFPTNQDSAIQQNSLAPAFHEKHRNCDQTVAEKDKQNSHSVILSALDNWPAVSARELQRSEQKQPAVNIHSHMTSPSRVQFRAHLPKIAPFHQGSTSMAIPSSSTPQIDFPQMSEVTGLHRFKSLDINANSATPNSRSTGQYSFASGIIGPQRSKRYITQGAGGVQAASAVAAITAAAVSAGTSDSTDNNESNKLLGVSSGFSFPEKQPQQSRRSASEFPYPSVGNPSSVIASIQNEPFSGRGWAINNHRQNEIHGVGFGAVPPQSSGINLNQPSRYLNPREEVFRGQTQEDFHMRYTGSSSLASPSMALYPDPSRNRSLPVYDSALYNTPPGSSGGFGISQSTNSRTRGFQALPNEIFQESRDTQTFLRQSSIDPRLAERISFLEAAIRNSPFLQEIRQLIEAKTRQVHGADAEPYQGSMHSGSIIVSDNHDFRVENMDTLLDADCSGIDSHIYNQLKAGLVGRLSALRESKLQMLQELETGLTYQVHFRPIPMKEVRSRCEYVTYRYSAAQERIITKYKNYISNLKRLEMHPTARNRKGCLGPSQNRILRRWYFEHVEYPYPTATDKEQLSRETGLTLTQVNNWFINVRVRNWKPTVAAMTGIQVDTNGRMNLRDMNTIPKVEQQGTMVHTTGPTQIFRGNTNGGMRMFERADDSAFLYNGMQRMRDPHTQGTSQETGGNSDTLNEDGQFFSNPSWFPSDITRGE